MRKVTAGLFHSVDGVVEAPDRWQFDSFDDELGQALGAMMSSATTVLLGRVGYQEWSGHWPDASDPFADFINGVEKFVASTTLEGPLEWNNSALIEGDLFDFVRELKAGDGGDIAVNAGITIVRELFFAGLLDELTLIQHPVIAGTGRHLFEPDDPTTRLDLVSSTATSKGNVVLVYRLRRD